MNRQCRLRRVAQTISDPNVLCGTRPVSKCRIFLYDRPIFCNHQSATVCNVVNNNIIFKLIKLVVVTYRWNVSQYGAVKGTWMSVLVVGTIFGNYIFGTWMFVDEVTFENSFVQWAHIEFYLTSLYLSFIGRRNCSCHKYRSDCDQNKTECRPMMMDHFVMVGQITNLFFDRKKGFVLCLKDIY